MTACRPVARLIGFTLTSIAPRHARIAFEAGAQHANPMGTLHGGILCDIADAAMGMAYASTLGAGETFTTLELKINFLKPVWQANCRPSAAWSSPAARWAWSNATFSTLMRSWLPAHQHVYDAAR